MRSIDGLRCLVSGSAGFVGSNLVHALLERGREVHGFDKAPAPFDARKLRWFQGVVRSVNIEGTRNMLRVAQESGPANATRS